MISLSAARALIAQTVRPLPAQTVSLDRARGRILREDVCATEDLPPFDRSAVDGYALRPDDASLRFQIAGEIQPGEIPKFKIHPGECARIFTGACIPQGVSRVVMQEHVQVQGNFIIPAEKTNASTTQVRQRGEDARLGDLLLKAGMPLGAGELALLASLGMTKPKVSAPVRIIHFATGNELVAPSQIPEPGQIRDSNSTLVAGFVGQCGGELAHQERVADDFDLLLQKIRACENRFDLLLLSGGASVGDYDFGKQLLTTLGFQVHFETINLRPGKPLIFATRGNQAAFVLPGNPISHFVTLHVAVRLALEQFAGAPAAWPLAGVRLAENLDHRPDARETFWPARVTAENNLLAARPLRWQSSGDVTGLAGANALLHLPGGAEALRAGQPVNALLLGLT